MKKPNNKDDVKIAKILPTIYKTMRNFDFVKFDKQTEINISHSDSIKYLANGQSFVFYMCLISMIISLIALVRAMY